MSTLRKHPEWLSIQQAADRWGVSYDTVRREVLAGTIPSMAVGAMHRISMEYIEQRELEGKQATARVKIRSLRRARALAASGKDHFPDC